MSKKLLPVLILTASLGGCATDGVFDSDSVHFHRTDYPFPSSSAHSGEVESARDINNRETANRHHERVIKERGESDYGHSRSGSLNSKDRHYPKTPDYHPSPKEKTRPNIIFKIPDDSPEEMKRE